MSNPTPTEDRLTRTQFIVAMATEIFVASRITMTAARALGLAARAFKAFERDVAFGDPAHAWDVGAAKTIAHEYEIAHWEAA